jgi:dissimilatory sulfite reductase (desulfoviridin) alpha/beta subunit
MTKVQMRFRLRQPLDEAALAGIAAVHAKYGIQKIKVADSQDSLMVEYDATRLRPAEVEAALAGAGISAQVE